MIEGKLPEHLRIRGPGTHRKRGAALACFVILTCVMALSTPGWDGRQGKVASFPDHWQETASTSGWAGYSVRAVEIDERLGHHIRALAQGDFNGTARHLVVLYCLESSPPSAYVYTPATIKDIEREQHFAPAWPSVPPRVEGAVTGRGRGSGNKVQSAEYAEELTGESYVPAE